MTDLIVGDGYDDQPLMTARDVAAALKLPMKSVYDLPIARVVLGPRRIRWRPEDVRDFIEGRRQVA